MCIRDRSEQLLNGHRVLPSGGSRTGAQYLAADGGRVPNLGKRKRGVALQAAEVKRPSLAVGALAKGGNDACANAS
eukprot:1766427-Alexandrium_andersonii.AAC.1